VSPPFFDRKCLTCGRASFESIHENQLAPLDGIDLSTTIGLCVTCGQLQACRMAPASRYEQYYRELSKTDHAQTLSKLDEARIGEAINFCREFGHTGMRVADIGCGAGDLLARLQKNGYLPVLGLDPAVGAPNQALQRFGLQVVEQGFIGNGIGRLRQTAPDIVFLMAVLEHLCDARSDFERIARSLKPGAVLVLEVPAIEGFDPIGGEPLGEFSIEHIQFFSKETLSRLIQSVGLNLIGTRLVPWPNAVGFSLFAACRRPQSVASTGARPTLTERPQTASRSTLLQYAAQGRARLQQCLARIPKNGPLVIYGAGAHTARILPMMAPAISGRIVAVVDGNPNLHGKRIGPFPVNPPSALKQHPNATVVISSYRSQEALANAVASSWSNPVCRLYPDALPTSETSAVSRAEYESA
jgi:SAM-dependent methyltransferase